MTIAEILELFVSWERGQSIARLGIDAAWVKPGAWINAGNISLHIQASSSTKEKIKLHSYGYCMADAILTEENSSNHNHNLKYILYKPRYTSVTTRKHITQLENALLNKGIKYLVVGEERRADTDDYK